jgi:hypothetical protein
MKQKLLGIIIDGWKNRKVGGAMLKPLVGAGWKIILFDGLLIGTFNEVQFPAHGSQAI